MYLLSHRFLCTESENTIPLEKEKYYNPYY